jgi:hypothetical protein
MVTRERYPFALTSVTTWMGINATGVAIFLWESQELWTRRNEGYTFGDGMWLLVLIAVFGFLHFLVLTGAIIIAVESRSWRAFRGLVFSLMLWGAVIGFHFMRIELSALVS